VATLLWSQTEDTADVRSVNDLAALASVTVAGPGWDAVMDQIQVPQLKSLRAAVDHFVQS
jgi:MerR family transcriptional regulator, light-induced transcriptional regulator